MCSVYYQNVRGLRTKCTDLFIASIACSYDIISFSETWLHSSIFDSELFHSDFVVYRCDRSVQSSVYSRGGGVLISVRSIYSSEQIIVPRAENIEIIFVKVQMNVNVYLCCLYIPPGSDSLIFQQFSDVFKSFIAIAQCKFDDIIVICGDFNCPAVDWFNDSDISNILFPSNSSSNDIQNMFNLLLSSGLSQI